MNYFIKKDSYNNNNEYSILIYMVLDAFFIFYFEKACDFIAHENSKSIHNRGNVGEKRSTLP